MASSSRVFNITRGCYLNHKAVLRGIENCSLGWVEEGISVRHLTYAEVVEARKAQAKLREPLCYAELPGIIFRPPVGQEKANGVSSTLVWEAHKFAREAA